MKNFIVIRLILMIVPIIFVADDLLAQVYDATWLINKFDQYDLYVDNGNGVSKLTNDNADLAWSESYFLEAYLDMYEATKNKKYIESFITQSQRVYNNSDNARGIKDYKGRTRTGWSSSKYSKNKESMIHLVHNGMILYPLVKFSLMVKNQKELSSYAIIANKFRQLAECAFTDFESQWRFDPRTGEGTYWFEGDEPLEADLNEPMPLNGPLSFGRVIVILYRVTGKQEYLLKARALAQYFKNHLIKNNDAYVWGYRAEMNKYPTVEDFSHGSIDVDFVAQAYQAGIIFTKDDLEAFSRTLVQARIKDKFSTYVNGKSDVNKDYSHFSGVWLELCSGTCTPYKKVYDYIVNRIKYSDRGWSPIMLGIAKLIKYYDKCGR